MADVRIIGEFVEGFDSTADIIPAVSFTVPPASRLIISGIGERRTAELLGKAGFNIMTGGGPGVMEAANPGAQCWCKSVGLNIHPRRNKNVISTPTALYFPSLFVRKVMLVKYATAFIIVPDGLAPSMNLRKSSP